MCAEKVNPFLSLGSSVASDMRISSDAKSYLPKSQSLKSDYIESTDISPLYIPINRIENFPEQLSDMDRLYEENQMNTEWERSQMDSEWERSRKANVSNRISRITQQIQPIQQTRIPQPIQQTRITQQIQPPQQTRITQPIQQTRITQPIQQTRIPQPIQQTRIPQPIQQTRIPQPPQQRETIKSSKVDMLRIALSLTKEDINTLDDILNYGLEEFIDDIKYQQSIPIIEEAIRLDILDKLIVSLKEIPNFQKIQQLLSDLKYGYLDEKSKFILQKEFLKGNLDIYDEADEIVEMFSQNERDAAIAQFLMKNYKDPTIFSIHPDWLTASERANKQIGEEQYLNPNDIVSNISALTTLSGDQLERLHENKNKYIRWAMKYDKKNISKLLKKLIESKELFKDNWNNPLSDFFRISSSEELRKLPSEIIPWETVSLNENAIDFIKEHLDKVDWLNLDLNPSFKNSEVDHPEIVEWFKIYADKKALRDIKNSDNFLGLSSDDILSFDESYEEPSEFSNGKLSVEEQKEFLILLDNISAGYYVSDPMKILKILRENLSFAKSYIFRELFLQAEDYLDVSDGYFKDILIELDKTRSLGYWNDNMEKIKERLVQKNIMESIYKEARERNKSHMTYLVSPKIAQSVKDLNLNLYQAIIFTMLKDLEKDSLDDALRELLEEIPNSKEEFKREAKNMFFSKGINDIRLLDILYDMGINVLSLAKDSIVSRRKEFGEWIRSRLDIDIEEEIEESFDVGRIEIAEFLESIRKEKESESSFEENLDHIKQYIIGNISEEDDNIYDKALNSLINNYDELGLTNKRRMDAIKKVILSSPLNDRMRYINGYANTAATMVDEDLMDLFYSLGARDIESMTLHALQWHDSSIAFSNWLRRRPDIYLERTITNFIDRDMIKTAEYLKNLPLDGRFYQDSVLGRNSRGLDN